MVLKNQKGFTLIELLVVVAIIGILAAIAIPQFAAYRAQSFCSSVEADVKNTVKQGGQTNSMTSRINARYIGPCK